MLLCVAKSLFYTVGLCGYLYAYDDTKDNILLNFPLDVGTVFVGRIGYGVTILFGMPLVFLPCRAAILSLPEQIRDRNGVLKQNDVSALEKVMKGAKHHVANSLTFDELTPLWIERKIPLDLERPGEMAKALDGTNSTINAKPAPQLDPSLQHEAERDLRVHVISTALIMISSFVMAVGVKGVGGVWSIAGSSIAMVIGFVIPASCYLKIRSKKNVNPRSVGALLLLLFSIIASIECTRRTVASL